MHSAGETVGIQLFTRSGRLYFINSLRIALIIGAWSAWSKPPSRPAEIF
jgi:hypothetical protein